MQQSNALRRLELILDKAISDGDKNQQSGPIILKAMKLNEQPQNILDFYELLNKAEEEGGKLKNIPRITRYLQTLAELREVFIVNHVWGTIWSTFASHIESRNVLTTLDALANYFHSQNPSILLEQDFLDKLNSEFESLLQEILTSDLSKELKRFLIVRLEDILQAIRRYHIDGIEGLEKATKSLMSDLVMTEHGLKQEDKKNSKYGSVKAWALSLLLYCAPSPYDIIGAVPDINEFWVPKFEELAAGHKKINQIICNAPTIQKAFEEASNTFNRQPQKSITGGKEIKALPAPKEELETNTENKSAD
jgi:hypothetical protein